MKNILGQSFSTEWMYSELPTHAKAMGWASGLADSPVVDCFHVVFVVSIPLFQGYMVIGSISKL